MGNQKAKSRGNGVFHPLKPGLVETGDAEVPSLCEVPGATAIIDLLMRRHVYIAFQAGRDGGVLGITVLDGADRSIAWCHTREQLLDILRFLGDKYGFEGNLNTP